MKKLTLILFFSVFFNHSSFSQGVWTWMGGDTTANGTAVYGTQGIPSVNNHPQRVYSSFCWTDLQGNFWLYGGLDTFRMANADLWRFNPTTLEWTWMKGNALQNQLAVYGTLGVPSPSNTPGSLGYTGCTWVDKNGDLWLYGGQSSATSEYPQALWRYNVAANEWTWMNGDTTYNPTAYGTKGVASALNCPGGRAEIGSSWIDNNGKFWMFGGSDGGGGMQDMWMYDPAINMWTWESGAQGGAPPVYGSKGIFSTTSTPGARYPYAMITENNGNFLLFGGIATYYFISAADLWEYNPAINQWAWVNGSKVYNDSAVAGVSCQSDTGFHPDGRFENRAVWKDCAGNFWMYGGTNNDSIMLTFGDVWVYLTATKQWARMSDSSYINKKPVFGTLGTSALSNHPGARFGTAHWKDSKGNFWIFGGQNNVKRYLTDMWRYEPDYSCINVDCHCASDAGVVTSSRDSICYGTGVTSLLTVNGNTGPIQWESSTDGINFTANLNDILSTYTTPPSLNQTTYYCTKSTDSCASTSNVVIVHIVPAPGTNFTYSANGMQYSFQPDSVTGGVITYHWDFGDGKTSNDMNAVHTFDSVKTYYVCLTVNNNSNCSFTRCQYVSAPNGVQNISAPNSIRLYPNPSNNELIIEVLNGNMPKQITITDDLGKTLIQLNTYKTKTLVDIHQLAAGIYFVKTQLSDGRVEVRKFVKE